MATVQDALQTQIRNIEAQYGRSMAEWTEVIRARGLVKHGQIVSMLKQEYGLSHGSANRVALVALEAMDGASGAGAPASDPTAELYADRPALRPIHDRLMAEILGLGSDIEVAPKKGYVSLRRRTQFAMIKPAAKHVDLGLILPDAPPIDRFEPAGTWNAMFSHRVRVSSTDEVDAELATWIRRAYDRAA